MNENTTIENNDIPAKSDDVTPDDLEGLLTPGRVAELLGIPETTLAYWRSERRGLPYVKVGRIIRYRPEDVRRWIDDNTIRPEHPALG